MCPFVSELLFKKVNSYIAHYAFLRIIQCTLLLSLTCKDYSYTNINHCTMYITHTQSYGWLNWSNIERTCPRFDTTAQDLNPNCLYLVLLALASPSPHRYAMLCAVSPGASRYCTTSPGLPAGAANLPFFNETQTNKFYLIYPTGKFT